jgi:hypothetical protein
MGRSTDVLGRLHDLLHGDRPPRLDNNTPLPTHVLPFDLEAFRSSKIQH